MTLALVKNDAVQQVGLPQELQGKPLKSLHNAGWYKIEGTPKPEVKPASGYIWTYGATWSVEDRKVYGEWSQTQRPQPYPSWSWVDGEGWVPPVPQPDGDYVWDEESQNWVEEAVV